MSGMVFSTFDWDQLGKILQHSWKKYLKISSKVIHFESDLLKTNEDIAPQRREIYRHLHGGGGDGVWWGGGVCQVFTHHHTPSYGLFAESGRVYSVQNSETNHFLGQGMNSNQQVIGKLGHVVQTDVFCLL